MPGKPPLDELAHGGAEKPLKETDGALARTTLLHASLPDQPGAQRLEHQAQRWTFEVPFMTPQGTAIAQFEASRDGKNPRRGAGVGLAARFPSTSSRWGRCTRWSRSSARRQAARCGPNGRRRRRLTDNAAMLSEALRAAELEPADFQFRLGGPPTVARSATPGRFMDRAA